MDIASGLSQGESPTKRPQHKKQPSRSNILKALVSPTKKRAHAADDITKSPSKTSDSVLGEIHSNVRSPPSSPRKGGDKRSPSKLPRSKTEGLSLATSVQRSSLEQAKDVRSQLKENASPTKSAQTSPAKSAPVDLMRSSTEYSFTPSLSPSKHSNDGSIGSENSRNAVSSESRSAEGTISSAMRFVRKGTKVMAAVQALQSKDATTPAPATLDPKVVETEFEAMLEARHIPTAMRENMRNLTLRIKADFVRQNQDSAIGDVNPQAEVVDDEQVDEPMSTKRSRPRSRTFTFSKGDRSMSFSPLKKQRSRSRSRVEPLETSESINTSPSKPRARSHSRRSRIERPEDYIQYLKAEQDPTKAEVGRLHKLRILLRNETVAWVNGFIDLDGMSHIIALLNRIMDMEWREEHEDQLLHETLLCLKGLCTTETALVELAKYADQIFPALLAMLFDDEKKGPAEYTTRTVIINILFAYLATYSQGQSDLLERRATTVLAYLSEPRKQQDKQPHTFVTDMHTSRPYKLWCRELTAVTREVFWIFLHQLNIISTSTSRPASASNAESDFTTRHFPGVRPPVPAAPYIGGVEWDATTYLAAHLDLLNGLVASLPSAEARNTLRAQLHASGFEKTMGGTLRTCKEKFYAGVHDGLRSWAAAAEEDGWPTQYVREGPSLEEQAQNAIRSSPKKGGKSEPAPQLEMKMEMPALDLKLDDFTKSNDNDLAWIG